MLSKLLKFFRKGEQDPFDDEDFSWMFPPQDLLDPDAWDRYWISHLEHGIGPQLADMFCWDDELVGVMTRAEMKTVLFVGSGISREPRALAEAGFTVVAMDLSPVAIEIARSVEFTPDAVESFFDQKLRRPGGSVDFVVGNFLDPSVCSGPFDVIIERRTAQLFVTRDLDGVMSCLSNRLNENCIFFSHCHDACWEPPADPVHYAESWFRDNGWNNWYGEGDKPGGRVAWTFTSTG
jgi:hypothetical protein